MQTDAWRQIDALEDELEEACRAGFAVELPLRHIFTPGLYSREIFLPAGTIVTSRIHLTQHPYVLSRGRVSVWEGGEWVTRVAPYTGITEPGTRRVVMVHEPSVWTTFHATDKTDPDEVMLAITYSKGKYAQLGIAAATPQPALP